MINMHGMKHGGLVTGNNSLQLPGDGTISMYANPPARVGGTKHDLRVSTRPKSQDWTL